MLPEAREDGAAIEMIATAGDVELRRVLRIAATPDEAVLLDLMSPTVVNSWGYGRRGQGEVRATSERGPGYTRFQRSSGSCDGVRRSAIAAPPAFGDDPQGYVFGEYTIELPERPADLAFGIGINETATSTDGVIFSVTLTDAQGAEHELFEAHHSNGPWRNERVSLADWAGEWVTLRFTTDCGPADDSGADSARWAEPRLLPQRRHLSVTVRPVADEAERGRSRGERRRRLIFTSILQHRRPTHSMPARDDNDDSDWGDCDPRNRPNDLTNREWLKLTKSVWYSRPGPRDELKSQHPATFGETDIERVISLFTKSGETVLDPFLGSGSTLIACARTGRRGIGIELVPRWVDLATERVAEHSDQPGLFDDTSPDEALQIIEGDSAEVLADFDAASVDLIVTSPPYWSILAKGGAKVAAERQDLPTKYSERADDLGNVLDYDDFLDSLCDIWRECERVLRPGRYMVVVVSDFRHGPRYYLYHADIAREIEGTGMVLKGTTVLVQDNKGLYCYCIPYSYVPNVHHQIMLILQKPKEE
jgi:DNA modification methylase